MWLQQVVFFSIAIILGVAALMVVLSSNPVHSALFLVLSFLASAVLWMLLDAEFLSLILVLVYVGAVMTLFLFVVMMLNVAAEPQPYYVRYLPLAGAAIALIVGLLIYVTAPQHFALAVAKPAVHTVHYSSVSVIGMLLYTHYAYVFECAGVLLLVAIVAAITLAYRGSARQCHSQNISDQIAVTPQERVELVSITPESEL